MQSYVMASPARSPYFGSFDSTQSKAWTRPRKLNPDSRIRLLRRHPREATNTRGVVHYGVASVAVRISNISTGGIGVEGAAGLFPGTEVKIALVTGEARSGVVRWWLAGSCGIEFDELLVPDDPFLTEVRKRSKSQIPANCA